MVLPNVVGSNGTIYTKEALAGLTIQAKEKISQGQILVYSKFEGRLEAVQGVVKDLTLKEDSTPVAKIDILGTPEGKCVVELLKEKEPLKLAWMVKVDTESGMSKDGDGVTTIYAMELDCMTFTDEHAFDVPSVVEVKDEG